MYSKMRPTVEGGRFLRLPEVIAFSGLGRTQLFEKIRAGEFPRPVKLTDSGRAIAWAEIELLRWREARLAVRDGRAA